MTANPTIGVLDLQGGVQEHRDHLERLGVRHRAVKTTADFSGLDGLIIPGGESTCLGRLLKIFTLDSVLEQEFARGLKLWGTCAGAILLARENIGEQNYFGFIDIAIKRNAFGSQLNSFNTSACISDLAAEPIPLTFIRAPRIVSTGAGVRVLLQIDDFVAAAEDDQVLVTVFHPELTPSLAFHRHFARKCGLETAATTLHDEDWNLQSWMRFSEASKQTEARVNLYASKAV